MLLQLTALPVSFIMRAKFSGEPYLSLVDSIDFIDARRRALEICVEEEKHSESQRAERDVGVGYAEEHFMDFHFPGFDDGFAAAYQYRKGADLDSKGFGTCHNQEFFLVQSNEMRDFIRRYRQYEESRHGGEFTFEQAYEAFLDNYFDGWTAGWRAGYCGLCCEHRESCAMGQKYLNSFVHEEEWMVSVHGCDVNSNDIN